MATNPTLATSHVTRSDEDILRDLNEEMLAYVLPLLLAVETPPDAQEGR